MSTPSHALRNRWLKAALPIVAERGWNTGTLNAAADAAGLTDGERALALPHGVNQLIDHMFETAADVALDGLDRSALGNLRTHEKVAKAIEVWLSALEPHKEAVAKAAARGLTPLGASAAAQQTWKTADLIWVVAGDTASDYNRQTKRALLSVVLPDIILYWTQTEDKSAISTRITKRLSQAMQVGKFGSDIFMTFIGTK